MALYKTHVKFNIMISFPICLFLTNYMFSPSFNEMSIFAISFIYATLFMNPDVDLAHKNHLFSPKGILTLPFRLYSMVFKHRGISHMPIIGSFTRIIFLALFLFSVSYIFDISFLKKINLLSFLKKSSFIHYTIAGIIIADLSHLLLDIKKN